MLYNLNFLLYSYISNALFQISVITTSHALLIPHLGETL